MLDVTGNVPKTTTCINCNLSQELKVRHITLGAKCSYQYKLKGKACGVIVLRISSITGLREPSSEGNKYTGNVELQHTHSITLDRSLINTPSFTQKNYAIYSNVLQRQVSPIQKQSTGGPDILQLPFRLTVFPCESYRKSHASFLHVRKTAHIWKKSTANDLRSNICDVFQSSRSLQHLNIRVRQLDRLVFFLEEPNPHLILELLRKQKNNFVQKIYAYL